MIGICTNGSQTSRQAILGFNSSLESDWAGYDISRKHGLIGLSDTIVHWFEGECWLVEYLHRDEQSIVIATSSFQFEFTAEQVTY